MRETITGLVTFIATTLLIMSLEMSARSDWPKTGYVVIDKKVYRLTPVE
jgi:hypothetical protein